MHGSKGNILVVDDSRTVRLIIESVLKKKGYKVTEAASGKEALRSVLEEPPDLIILDLELPDISGFDVCKRIRSDPTTHRIPIVVLTVLEQTAFEIRAIDAGADDFITKPVDPSVLDSRISMIIRRLSRERLANPLTGLPGSVQIDQEITRRLAREKVFSLCYADLDNFKSFNDKYGYQRGDEIILLTAGIIRRAIAELGNRGDFIGHVGGDDFIFVTTPDKAIRIAKKIIKDFDCAVPAFYDDGTQQRRYFIAIDRRGNKHKVPVLTISVAMVHKDKKDFKTSLEIVDDLTELKNYAKSLERSVYVCERRTLTAPKESSARRKQAVE